MYEGFRLSAQQRQLWLQRGQAAQVVQAEILLTGPLSQAALRSAIETAAERHEILRTTFQYLPGVKTPVQVIAERAALIWQEHDLSAEPAATHAARSAELAEAERGLAFDLQRGPLLRAALLRLDERRHRLVITQPALSADSGALNNLLDELIRAYDAAVEGRALDDEPIQFVEFSEWQQELLAEEQAETGAAYWRQRGAAAPLLLPYSSPFVAAKAAAPAELSVTIERAMYEQLATVARQQQTTSAVLLLACWQALLWRLTGQSEIGLRYLADGRKYDELRETLGPFARWLPLQQRFDDELRFDALVGQVAQAVAAAHEWQEYLPAELGASEGPSLGFEFQPQHASQEAAGVRFSMEQQRSLSSPLQIQLTCAESDDGLLARFSYDPASVSATTIGRLARSFATLVVSAATSPQAPVGALALLTPAERQELLTTPNRTEVAYPALDEAHRLFEAQAARTPDAPAAVFGEHTLSYAALNERADQLARRLRGLGVGPNTIVGLFVERSLEQLAALLAILKTGGAYLPLDPSDPAERLQLILSDAQVGAVITQPQLRERLASYSGPILELDAAGDDQPADAQLAAGDDQLADAQLAAGDDQLADAQLAAGDSVGGDDLAYVIYTSGSTGQPKGVAIEHRSLLNYLHWLDRELLPAEVTWLPLLTRLTFDASLKQIFVPWMRGQAVWVLPPELLTQPAALLQEIAARRHVALNCVPTFWSVLLQELEARQISLPDDSLTHLLLGGERLPAELLERTLARLPQLEIWNLYGPTETTANVSAGRVRAGQPVTIGRPLSNVQLYVLDRYGQPVPPGVAGELHVGGAQLARGYLNRPELTAQQFITAPFAAELPATAGARLYRTGDLVRWCADDQLEYLGRIDEQVKLRGFRVELGEIESVLQQHPAVRQAAVAVQMDDAGEQRLLAYVVAEEPRTEDRVAQRVTVLGSPMELREFLQEKLPAYMIPASFVRLEALPLTPTGKLNRRALTTPGALAAQRRMEPEQPYVAPRTPAETILARVWTEVLGIERAGVEDNFFELGGHSIQSIQICYKANQAGLQITPEQLFQYPTIAGLAAVAQEIAPAGVAQAEADLVEGEL